MGTGSFQGVKCGGGVTLTPHPLLVPRSKIEWSYTSTLPKGFRGLWKGETYLHPVGTDLSHADKQDTQKLTDAFCRFAKVPKSESERGCEILLWIELLQYRVKFHVFVNTITNFQLCYKDGEYSDWLSKILKISPHCGLFFFPSWTDIHPTCIDYMAVDVMWYSVTILSCSKPTVRKKEA